MIDSSLWMTAIDLQQFLEKSDHPFCFIGGVVVGRWGQPRVTADVDATILTTFGKEAALAGEILKRYQSRIENPIPFAIQARILLLQDIRNNNIDLSIGGMDFEHRVIERSSHWGVPGGGQIRTCSAEDLIVLKAFASRPQDWIDVEHVINRQGTKLDRHLIQQELTPLVELKEAPEIATQLQTLFDQHPPTSH